MLNNEAFDKPFFLSGGLSLDNINKINMIKVNENIYGLDLNSKFEISPGLKDIEKINKLFNLNL
jgi:phosphoribosylanthranilate isomerase